MNRAWIYPILTALLLTVLISGAFSQQARFRIPFHVTDSSAEMKSQTIWIGVHPNGVTCINGMGPVLTNFTDRWDLATFYPPGTAALEEGPPAAPDPIFTVGITQPCSGLNDVPVSVKPFTSSSEVDSFSVSIIGELTHPFSTKYFSWPDPSVLRQYCDSLILKGTVAVRDSDDGTGNIIYITQKMTVRLTTDTGYTARKYPSTSPLSQLIRFKLYLYHPKTSPPLPPATVVPVYPARGGNDTAHTLRPTFSWQPVAEAAGYILQVSRDSVDTALTAIVVNQQIPAGVTSTTIGTTLLPATKYYWRVYAYNTYGYSYTQSPQYWFITQNLSGVVPDKGIPAEFSLREAQPNPFNPSTTLRFEIRDLRFVILRVYDVLGKEVATLVNEKKEPGSYTVEWNAGQLPSGVYFCRLTAVPPDGYGHQWEATRKMMLVR